MNRKINMMKLTRTRRRSLLDCLFNTLCSLGFRKGNVYSGAELKKEELLAAISAFQQTARAKEKKKSKKGAEPEFEVSGVQKWADVVQTMEDARGEYEKRHEGKRMTAIDNFLNRIGTSGPVFQAWLDILPNGDYGSVICGAFGLVIKVSTLSCLHDNHNTC